MGGWVGGWVSQVNLACVRVPLPIHPILQLHDAPAASIALAGPATHALPPPRAFCLLSCCCCAQALVLEERGGGGGGGGGGGDRGRSSLPLIWQEVKQGNKEGEGQACAAAAPCPPPPPPRGLHPPCLRAACGGVCRCVRVGGCGVLPLRYPTSAAAAALRQCFCFLTLWSKQLCTHTHTHTRTHGHSFPPAALPRQAAQ